jgi:hypothetical protein
LDDPAKMDDLSKLVEAQRMNLFEKFQNFPLHQMEFQEHTLELVVLSPAAVLWISRILK